MSFVLGTLVACVQAAPASERILGAEGEPSATPPPPVVPTPSGPAGLPASAPAADASAAPVTGGPSSAVPVGPRGALPALAQGWSSLTVTRGPAGPGPDVPVAVYTPAHASGAWVLLLHGWNQHARDWAERTHVSTLAESQGWTLVAPDLGKSVYESRGYPGMGSTVPGLGWTRDVLVPWTVTTLGCSDAPERRAVVGVSTGGRGAALLGEAGLFGAVAAFSGTYDLAALAPSTGEYRIHAVVFGERAAHPETWRREDVTGRSPPTTRWWLAHGGKDAYVPQAQTRTQAARLAAAGAPVVTWLDADAGHDWPIWDAWLGRVGAGLIPGTVP